MSGSSSPSSWSDGDRNDKKKKKPTTTSGRESDDKEFDSDGNELYVVEDIRDKKRHWDPNKKAMVWLYHLKWKGYSEKDMSWEPVEHMDCPDLLNDFERRWKAQHKGKDEKSRDKERERADRYKMKDKERPKDRNRERRKSVDSDHEKQRPSTSGLSKSDLKPTKKRRHSSESDDSSDERRKKRQKHKKEKKTSKKKSDSDSDDDRKKTKKAKSDSESDSEKKKESLESDVHKKIMSKPGPKRAKEARLAKLKEEEERAKKAIDSDDDKKKKSYKSDDDSVDKKNNDSDDNIKKIMSKPGPKRAKEARLAKLNQSTEDKAKDKPKPIDSDDDLLSINVVNKNKSNDSASDEEKTAKIDKPAEEQRIMSKPGPKRAKEARLAKLNQSTEDRAKEKPKPIDSDNDLLLIKDIDKNKSNDSDSNSEKTSKVDKPTEEQRIMSKPGPKRAKEARLAKLNSTPATTTTVEKAAKSDDEDSNDNKISKSVSNSDSESEKTKKKTEIEENLKKQKELILSKPGPKRAKEAQLAKLNQSKSEDNNNNNNNNKISDNKSSDDENSREKESTKETEKSDKISPKNNDDPEERRKSILSRPGPKRAKEARLQKLNLNSGDQNNKTNKGLENKRTNSTDSLDAIISTPAPEEGSLEMEQLEAEITSPKQPLSNGNDSIEPSPEGVAVIESNDLSGLDRIGNYVSIQTTSHVTDITNALSLINGGLDMKRPGFVDKHFDIKSFPTNSKTIEKIISAFYSMDKRLCFLIKWNGFSKCDVVLADDVNKHCPQLVIEYYQSKLQFS